MPPDSQAGDPPAGPDAAKLTVFQCDDCTKDTVLFPDEPGGSKESWKLPLTFAVNAAGRIVDTDR
jgi:hypothetical protein